MIINLHQRRKKAQHVLGYSLQGVPGAILQRDFLAGREGGKKVLLHFFDAWGFVHPDAAFKVEVKAAEIEVGCAHSGRSVIGHKSF